MSLRGAIDRIPLEAVLQLLAETGKTGHLEIFGAERSGTLGLSGGRLVTARSQDDSGEAALGELFTAERGEFEFTTADRVEGGDLSGDLDDLLDRAVAERDRIAAIREIIPDERVRFALSPRAAESAEIRLSAEQWRALLAIDGTRDVAGVTQQLGVKRLTALDLLAGLLRAGLIEAQPFAGQPLPPVEGARLERTPGGEPVALSGRTSEFPLEAIVPLLAATKQTGRVEVESAYGLATLGLAGGRLVSARTDDEEGDLALGATFALDDAPFRFVPTSAAPAADLTGDLEGLLARAAETRERIGAIRALMPNERVRFALSERATQHGEITLTPAEWKALLAVRAERDLAGVASELGLRRLPTMVILADLIEGGLVDVREAPPEPPPPFAAAPPEEPLAETPLDVAPADDRLSAITGAVGAPEPITEVPPPPTTWEEPLPAEAAPSAPAGWELPSSEPGPAWEAPPLEEPSAAEPEPLDPRLAAFGAPAAPEAPGVPPGASTEPYVDPRLAWTAPAAEAPAETTAPAAEEPAATDLVVDLGAEAAPPEVAAPEAPAVEAPRVEAPVAPAPVPQPAPAAAPAKRGVFGGLFAPKQPAAPVGPPPPASQLRTRSGQLALFVNELLRAYNSGQYGKGRIEDRMASLLMRADEQADPVDRPLPVKHDRLDVAGIDGAALPERQSLPYLAMLVRQVYDEAERTLGKDKAKRGFKETRERLFGKDTSLFQAPEIAQRVPKA